MTLQEYQSEINAETNPLRQATLVFLMKPNEILLAMKKRGFGIGKWNGVGGKVEVGETAFAAAKREVKEEVGVSVDTLRRVGVLNFYFPHVPEDKNWNQQVVLFATEQWSGEPRESDEMAPEWYRHEAIPYDDMWPDDRYWMPKMLAGEFVVADFLFAEDQTLLDMALR